MAYQDELVGTASFRGVPFKTKEAEIGVGRRGVLNEYPLRDEPFTDDLGRRARLYRVDGHLVGPDYLAQRDALIEAFETKGPGELVHPRYGTVWVSLHDDYVRFRESDTERGIARFTAVFVEDTDNQQPSTEADTSAEVESTSAAADEAAGEAFADLVDVSGPEVLADELGAATLNDVNSLTDVASLFSDSVSLGDILTTAGNVIAEVAELVRVPLQLVAALSGLFMDVAVSTRPDLSPSGPLSALREINLANRSTIGVTASRSVFADETAALSRGTLSRTVINDSARADLQRRLSITAQARVLAIAITDGTVLTAQQATTLRDQLVEQIDTELEQADPDAATAAAFSRLRAAVVRDVAVRAELLKQRSTFTPAAVLPALVLAHRIYQDADRADELVARNGVPHPAFVPVQSLEILL
ncbi:DNA circularization protein [Variovorax gossypii]